MNGRRLGRPVKTLSPDQAAGKRAQAQALPVTMHVGKNGVTEATVAELKAQLHKHKLVKVRLLPAATEGSGDRDQAEALAGAADAALLEVRGHTAVFWRG
jgi:RNA-binding protein